MRIECGCINIRNGRPPQLTVSPYLGAAIPSLCPFIRGTYFQLTPWDANSGCNQLRKVSEYKQHALECRQMASRMQDPVHRKQLEDMAEAWSMLAREREKQLAKQANPAMGTAE
jgi:hypothetical protein